jgi:hypothetical protein
MGYMANSNSFSTVYNKLDGGLGNGGGTMEAIQKPSFQNGTPFAHKSNKEWITF